MGKIQLKDKNILIGVTGSIAAYKIANLVSMLVKTGANVDVIMTKNACNFINPITFETLTSNKCLVDTFDRNFEFEVEHISLAKKADLVMIAPASANVIGKIACGIADDMLTTTIMACKCKKIIAPAMNTNMYENLIVQDNIRRLKKFGYVFIEPDVGRLACKDVGAGKLPKEEVLFEYIMQEIMYEKDLVGKKILVSAGPTLEAIDPVRFISNHSTGKMGYAIAKTAARRGADVTLVSGPVHLDKPLFVNVIDVKSAEDMYQAIFEKKDEQDLIVKAAAVADYTPVEYYDEKLKKKDGDNSIALKRTKDILAMLGENKREGQFLCGFSMETENMIENSKAKLEKKNLDMIVANNLKVEGAGFGTDTNVASIIRKDKDGDIVVKELSIMSKEELANNILDSIFTTQNQGLVIY